MSLKRVLPLAVVCLLTLSAVADDSQPLDLDRGKLVLKRRVTQRTPGSSRFALDAMLPQSPELAAFNFQQAEYEVEIGGVTAFFVAGNSLGKLVKQPRPGVWRARSGWIRIKIDANTGRLRYRIRRSHLAPLLDASAQDVNVRVRFSELVYETTVDFETRAGGKVWRHTASTE